MSEKTFCPSCKAQVNPEDGFCGICGCSLEDGTLNEKAFVPFPAKAKTNAVLQKFNGLPKKTRIIVASAVAAILVALTVITAVVVVNSTYTTIDMRKAVVIEYRGLNGNASAVIGTDDDYMENIVSEILKIDLDELENIDFDDLDYGETAVKYKKAYKLAALLDSIEIECTPNDELSNGDKVTVEVSFNKERFKREKIKIKNASFTVEVEGLSDGAEYDVFKDVKLDFTGISPNLSVSIDTSECDDFVRNNVSFSLDKSYSVKNGDIITATANVNESAAESEEYIIKETTKQYTISGQAEYLSSVEGVDTSAFYAEMNDRAKATAASWVGEHDRYIGTVTSSVIEGEPTKWLLTKKSSDIYGDVNKCIAVYGCNAVGDEGTTVWYIVVEVQDLVKNADGSVTWDYINVLYPDGDYSSVKAKYVDSYVNNYIVTEIK